MGSSESGSPRDRSGVPNWVKTVVKVVVSAVISSVVREGMDDLLPPFAERERE